jgi:2-polyprenyl-3-methyl-5-hydroxy-6-metoxy-1,4-benzoquinol methylase
MPLEEDIGKAYLTYYTHSDRTQSSKSLPARVYRYIKNSYLASKFGYTNAVDRFSILNRVLGSVMYLHPPRRADLDFSVMHVPFKQNGRLLEIGCGSGGMLSVMQSLGWQVEGVEVDPLGVEVARSKGLNVHLGDVFSKKYAGNSFDAITLSHVIEHVHDPIGLIEECKRILKPGGMISMVTPNSKSFGHSVYKNSWLHLDPPRHLHIFNPNVLESLLTISGLQTVVNETLIRDANNLFIGCHSIKKIGSYEMGSNSGVVEKVWGRVLQMLEWIMLKVMPSRGEEILLVVRK